MLDGVDVQGIALHFLVLPFVLFVVSRVVLATSLVRLIPGCGSIKLSSDDVLVLSQRFTRGVIATTLVYGGFSSLFRHPSFASSLTLHHDDVNYWLLGTVAFYTLDCAVLVLYWQTNLSMWVHHVLAILLFLFSYILKTGSSGCMISLLAEALVPWGFLLFFFRSAKLEHTAFFSIICFGGMTTLILRACLWSYVMYLHLTGNSFQVFPLWFSLFVQFVITSGFWLEYTWFNLYLKSYQKARETAKSKKN